MGKFKWSGFGTGGMIPVNDKTGSPEDVVMSVVAPDYFANRSNLNLSEYQYSKELEMWNRQNEYNSPLNQMKRFENAGLNPNLVATQGNSGNATQMPKYNAPTVSYTQKIPMVMNMLQTYSDLDVKQAQSDKLKEETNGVRLQNDLMNVQKKYWESIERANWLNKLNSSEMTIMEREAMIRKAYIDFGYKIIFDREAGKYVIDQVEDFDNSDAYRKSKLELGKTSSDVELTNQRIEGQKNLNAIFKSDKAIGWILNLLRLIK